MKSHTRLLLASALTLACGMYMQPSFSARPVLTGEVAEQRVHDLTTQINWHDDLKDAEKEAQSSGKLIFWMHILGHIDGAT